MSRMTATVRTVHGMSTAVGWSGNRTLTIDRAEVSGGSGLGFNGGELMLLALGACFTNDIFREAARFKIAVQVVSVEVSCDWGGDPVRAQNVRFKSRVEAQASESRIRELIEHTDRVAEIHNSLRFETPVTLENFEAVELTRL